MFVHSAHTVIGTSHMHTNVSVPLLVGSESLGLNFFCEGPTENGINFYSHASISIYQYAVVYCKSGNFRVIKLL